jgi:hypothetical protein
MRMLEEDARTRRGVCNVWEQIQAKGQEGSEERISRLCCHLIAIHDYRGLTL